MNVLVSLDQRFERSPDGAVWTPGQFASSFWNRYLEVFDGVSVLARVRDVSAAPEGWKRSDAPGVSFTPLPNFVGPWQYLLKSSRIKRSAGEAVMRPDAVILRTPSNLDTCMRSLLGRSRRPYGVEVVADPYDVFAPGSIRHPLRPFLRWWSPRQLRKQCEGACAAAYVTEEALQRRYPPGPGTFSTHYSSIELPQSAFVAMPRQPKNGHEPCNLVLVGTLAQLYKAPDTVLDALALCLGEGTNLRLTIIGDGKHRPELEARAAALGLTKRVSFLGQLAGADAVRAELDRADLFVLPSRHEGLPRAMIEAMARALPCIGSTAGGIPELLPNEDMVTPGDAGALAGKIREVVTAPERMARMSARNLVKAREYSDDCLRPRRISFYEYLRAETKRWLQSQKD